MYPREVTGLLKDIYETINYIFAMHTALNPPSSCGSSGFSSTKHLSLTSVFCVYRIILQGAEYDTAFFQNGSIDHSGYNLAIRDQQKSSINARFDAYQSLKRDGANLSEAAMYNIVSRPERLYW